LHPDQAACPRLPQAYVLLADIDHPAAPPRIEMAEAAHCLQSRSSPGQSGVAVRDDRGPCIPCSMSPRPRLEFGRGPQTYHSSRPALAVDRRSAADLTSSLGGQVGLMARALEGCGKLDKPGQPDPLPAVLFDHPAGLHEPLDFPKVRSAVIKHCVATLPDLLWTAGGAVD